MAERLFYTKFKNCSAEVELDDSLLDDAFISVTLARKLVEAARAGSAIGRENARLVLKVEKLEQEQTEMLAAMRKLSGIVGIWL